MKTMRQTLETIIELMPDDNARRLACEIAERARAIHWPSATADELVAARAAIAAARRHATGEATDDELAAANEAVWDKAWSVVGATAGAASVSDAVRGAARAATYAANAAANAAAERDWQIERANHWLFISVCVASTST